MSYKKEIRETFQNVQHSKAKYPKYIKKLKEVYEKVSRKKNVKFDQFSY